MSLKGQPLSSSSAGDQLIRHTDFHFLSAEAWLDAFDHGLLTGLLEPPDNESADVIKQSANALYREGKYTEAIAEYHRAFGQFREGSALLSNRAACKLKLMDFKGSLQDAVAAALMDLTNAKALYRACTSLIELETQESGSTALDAARRIAEYGLNHCEGAKANFQELYDRITITKKIEKMASTSASELLREDDGRIDEKQFHAMSNASPLETVRLLNQLLEISERSGKTVPGLRIDKRVSPYHTEYVQYAVWPRGVDTDKCWGVLEKSYEQVRSIGINELYLTSSLPQSDEFLKPSQDLLLKRLGELSEENLTWFASAPIGDIRQVKHRRGYDRNMFHSFTNEWSRPEYYYTNSTHVAVGFVDLGSLREGIFPPDITNFKWVGYEASPYAAAKTLVVAEMLKSNAPVDDIIQVWYSAAWSKSAEVYFRKAVAKLIEGQSYTAEELYSSPALRSPKVMALLRHWLLHSVSLEKARADWLEYPILNDEIVNFLKMEDRLALSTFILTGQLLEADVGSITMFSIPSHEKVQRALREYFMYCIDERALFEERKRNSDIIAAAVACLRTSISRLRTLINQREVTVVIHHQSLSLENHDLLSSISSLNPLSISWSNVCDYFSPKDFHKMARACSSNETIHFAYSMNWPMFVKGAGVIDFETGDKNHKLFLKKMIIGARLAIHEYNKSLSAEELMLDPPITNVRNLAEFMLYMQHYEGWVRWFFSNVNPCKILNVEKKTWRYISRVNSTVFFAYTYNPDIDIVGSSARY